MTRVIDERFLALTSRNASQLDKYGQRMQRCGRPPAPPTRNTWSIYGRPSVLAESIGRLFEQNFILSSLHLIVKTVILISIYNFRTKYIEQNYYMYIPEYIYIYRGLLRNTSIYM